MKHSAAAPATARRGSGEAQPRSAAADEHALAEAAQGGDRQALNELIRRCLPAVYGLVRRRSAAVDIDDVVQEALLRAVRSLRTLRDPARFRSWLLAIAVRESGRRHTVRRMEFVRAADDEISELSTGLDEEQQTLARLALAEQRYEVSEAAGWLDRADQDLLALWWLELVGQLDRAELAHASGVSASHLRVRLQRLRERLDRARALVRVVQARDSAYGCPGLREATTDWDGDRSPLWRKRLARHTDGCRRCDEATGGLVPIDRLLAGVGVPLVPAAVTHAMTNLPAGVLASAGSAGKVALVLHALAAKPVAVVATAVVVAAGGTVAWTVGHRSPEKAAASTVASTPQSSAVARSAAPAPSVSATPTATPKPAGNGITFTPAPGTGQGHTYYVSPSGDDHSAGTAARPFRTINHATQATLHPGDTVQIAAGTYVEKVRLRGSGSATHGHITLRGEPGAVIKDPSPGGNQNWIPGGTVVADRVAYWLIEGLHVEHSEWGSIVLAGTSHVIVANNQVEDAGASGIIALPATGYTGGEQEVQSHNLTIVGNTLTRSNSRWAGSAAGNQDQGAQEALSVWGVDGFEVAGNRLVGCTREGIDAKTGSRHGRIHHNTVSGCASISGTAAGYRGGAAVYLDGNRTDMFDIEVDHNDVRDNVADAVVVADEAPDTGDVKNVRIHDNLIRRNGRHGLNGGAGVTVTANVSDVLIERNTFTDDVQAFVFGRSYLAGYDPRRVVFRGNVAAGSSFRNGAVLPVGSVTISNNLITTGFANAYEVDGANTAAITASGNKRVAKATAAATAGFGYRGAAGAPAGPATPTVP